MFCGRLDWGATKKGFEGAGVGAEGVKREGCCCKAGVEVSPNPVAGVFGAS
jgi:hypothetical protein